MNIAEFKQIINEQVMQLFKPDTVFTAEEMFSLFSRDICYFMEKGALGPLKQWRIATEAMQKFIFEFWKIIKINGAVMTEEWAISTVNAIFDNAERIHNFRVNLFQKGGIVLDDDDTIAVTQLFKSNTVFPVEEVFMTFIGVLHDSFVELSSFEEENRKIIVDTILDFIYGFWQMVESKKRIGNDWDKKVMMTIKEDVIRLRDVMDSFADMLRKFLSGK